jgi:hypothetical protein
MKIIEIYNWLLIDKNIIFLNVIFGYFNILCIVYVYYFQKNKLSLINIFGLFISLFLISIYCK